MTDTVTGWYVSDAHVHRALGYLGVELVQRGDLPGDFELPILLELFGAALGATMQVDDDVPSPIGAYGPGDERDA